jgi:hypothetical protein
MWVKSEDGNLYNLDQAIEIKVQGGTQNGRIVEVRFNTPPGSGPADGDSSGSAVLAEIATEEEAKQVLQRISGGINRKDAYLDLSEPPHSSML